MSECCTTVRDIVQQLSRILADEEHVRWPVPVLVQYINEALSELLSYRPDAFQVSATLELQEGRVQRLPATYFQLVDIIANVGDSTDIISEVSEDVMKSFSARPCNGRDNLLECYRVLSWSRVGSDPRLFLVSPPVPKGMAPLITALVIAYPPKHRADMLDSCLGVPRTFDAQVVDWVLHRAYGEDMESTPSREMSVRHRAQFYESLGVEYIQESRFRSGRWLGRQPDGRPDTTQQGDR